MVKATKARQSIEEERVRIAALLSAYGSLLTQRQLSLATQFCSEGKNFSQIAREREVSRQAVHEAIRSVQQQLELFEMKLGLVTRAAQQDLSDVTILMDKIKDLRQRIEAGELGDSIPEALIQELDRLINPVEKGMAGLEA
jgi:predicted DNA-binding protein YlxM (UPF0122 family)